MNLRNVWLVRVVRILLGLFFIFSGVSGFMLAASGWQGVPPESLANTQAFWDTGVFQLVKGMEVVAGLMLVIGFLPWLGAVFLAPIGIGASVVAARTAPQYAITPVVLSLLLVYLGYVYWDRYKQLFRR